MKGDLFDVTVVRYMDGHRIEHTHCRLTDGEVLVLKYAEQCLPGEIRSWAKLKSKRPWTQDAPPDR